MSKLDIRHRLGRHMTYHKSGAVSFRLSEFLASPKGQRQLERAAVEAKRRRA